jgi:glucosamine kinase
LNSSLFLGVDGGGTTCRARLCDSEGRTLGEGRAGPANLRFGVEESFAAVSAATRQCFASAGLPDPLTKQTAACLALAGASEPIYLAEARAYPHPFHTMAVTTDAHAACVGAHGGRDGGIVVVGTGTIGWARIGGHCYRVGGWGFPVSDEGSGAWIGCEAARRVLWAQDGRITWTGLLREIFVHFHGDPHELVRWMSSAKPRDFGRLAKIVTVHAPGGDPVASELMRAAAQHIETLAMRLHDFGVNRIALVGGLAAAIVPWLSADVRPLLVDPEGDAVTGALRIAMQFAPAHEMAS